MKNVQPILSGRSIDVRSNQNQPSKLFDRFFYITHVDNLESIRQKGILSHNGIKKLSLSSISIADEGAQRRKDRPEAIYGRPIHDYVPLYINPRNPMLYKRRNLHEDLVVLKISASIVDRYQYIYTDGNAASRGTNFSIANSVVEIAIPVLTSLFWKDHEDGKRKSCAEILVHPYIESMYIEGGICSNAGTAKKISNEFHLSAVVRPEMFFL